MPDCSSRSPRLLLRRLPCICPGECLPCWRPCLHACSVYLLVVATQLKLAELGIATTYWLGRSVLHGAEVLDMLDVPHAFQAYTWVSCIAFSMYHAEHAATPFRTADCLPSCLCIFKDRVLWCSADLLSCRSIDLVSKYCTLHDPNPLHHV